MQDPGEFPVILLKTTSRVQEVCVHSYSPLSLLRETTISAAIVTKASPDSIPLLSPAMRDKAVDKRRRRYYPYIGVQVCGLVFTGSRGRRRQLSLEVMVTLEGIG